MLCCVIYVIYRTYKAAYSHTTYILRRRTCHPSILAGAFFFCIFSDDAVRRPRWKILECWCSKSRGAPVTSRNNVHWTGNMRGRLNRWDQPPKWAKNRTAACDPRWRKECTMVHTFDADVVFYVRKLGSKITNVFGPWFWGHGENFGYHWHCRGPFLDRRSET